MSESKEETKRAGSVDHEDPHLVSATGIPLTNSTSVRLDPQVDIVQEHVHQQLLPQPTPIIHHEGSDEDDSTGAHKHIKSPATLNLHIHAHEDLAVISHKGVNTEEIHTDHGFKPKLRKQVIPPAIIISEALDRKKRRSSAVTSSRPSVRTLYKGTGSIAHHLSDVVLNKSKIDLSRLKEGIMPAKKAESRWDTAFHQLSRTLAGVERFVPRKIVFDDLDSDDDKVDEGTYPESTSKDDDIFVYTPFDYSYKPFRVPKLGEEVNGKELDEYEAPEEGESEVPDYEYQYKLESVPPPLVDWVHLAHPTNLFNIIRKWNCPEPCPEDKPLPVAVDPAVKYKLERKAKRLQVELERDDDLKHSQPTNEEMERIQKRIGIGITPSGRKLAGYSSDSGGEKVFKRVQCRHDPDFDVLEPSMDAGPEGDWPNPYLHYWNWKQTDEDVDELIKPGGDHSERDREIAEELERDPMKIPLCRIGSDDTDESDPGDPQKKYYRKYYKIWRMQQAQKRKCHLLFLKMRGKYHSGFSTCTRYPMWYWFWKKCFRRALRKIPRRWKFIKESNTKTLFYGTMASLYQTQYLAEYDLLPNMDDPVLMSEVALAKSMEIKEQFLVQPTDGSKPYVDYINLQRSDSYKKYFECIGLLCRYQPIKMPPRSLQGQLRQHKQHYFNVLSIQTQIRRIPEMEYMKYLWEMEGFWGRTKGLAGYLELSLEEIYHGILRCNRIHPLKQARVFVEDPKGFPKEMSTSRLSLDWFDPRIHFALNVGTKSCAPLMIFSLYEQDCQLEEVTRTYVRSRVKIEEQTRTVTLPILFLWYEKDFGNNQRVLLWYLKRYLFPKDTLKIRRLVTSNKTIKFRYERPDDELEPLVVRHPPSECRDEDKHKNIIPEYWGHRF